MRYEDTSGSVGHSGTPEARDDADALATGSNGPATGNVISGAGTLTGKAGEDTAANGHVVAIRGAGGTDSSDNGQSLHVDGRYGALVIDEHGNYKYVADGRAPADFRDLFQYTLADSKGGRSVADLVITRGAELKVADSAQRVVPGPDGVVTLPAGVDLNDVHVVGRNLVVTLPDGSQIVIVDGAVFVPQLVLGGVEVPSTNLAALLIDAEPKPAAGNTQSSGGNFDVPVPPLDPGVPLGDLIPPTELVFTPPEIKEIGQFIDKHPEAGTVSVQLDDDDVPGKNGNPGGVGDDQGAPNATTSGNLPGSGGDGALTWDLSNGGAPAGFSYVDGPNGSILVQQVQGGNTVTVLTITIDASTGAYTVTENAPILHPAGDNENNVAFTINYTVTDADGDTAPGTLNINVDDDTPTVSVTAGSDANVSLTTHDAATIGANSEAVSTSANFGGVFNGTTSSPGADGAGVGGSSGYALSTTGGASGLFSHGVAINLYNVAGVIIGSTATTAAGIDASNTVFSVSTDNNGIVTLTQFSQIDHTADPSPTGAPFTDDIMSLTDGSITLTRSLTVVDKDGDSVTGSASVGIGANLHFVDDGPSIGLADHGEPTLVVDETDLSHNDTQSFAANFSASFGADGPAANSITYALGISAPGADSGLIDVATGQHIFLVLNNGVVEGHVGSTGGALAFTVSVNAAGDVTLDQILALQHPDANNPDTDETVTLSADNLVTLTATAHDFDGDTASSTINIGTNLVFHDDGPTAAIGTTGQTVSLDETVGVQGDSNDVAGPLAQFAGVANKGVDPDMATQFAANANAVVNSTGTVFGADGGTATFSLNVSSAGVDSGLNTTDGHDIVLTLENGIVVGRVSGGADDGKAAFAISIDSSGHISMVEWLSIQHPVTSNPDDSLSIANGAVLAVVTATDNDGDSSTASTAIGGLISFQDDGPTAAIGTTGQTVSLDETPGVQGDSNDVAGPLAQFAGVANKGVDPDMATQFAANANAIVNSTGTVFGADGGAAVFSLNVSAAGVDSGLNTTDGHDIVLTLENGIVVGRVVGGVDDGKAAFAVSIDSTGHISMVEWLSIQHPNTGNPDDSVSIANGAILAVVTATDGDGDTSTASTAIGGLISFQDDGPTAVVGTTGQTVSLDETVGIQGDSNDVAGPLAQFAGVSNKGVDPDMATQFAANANAVVNSTGTALGADGAGSAVFSLNVSAAGVDSGLNTTDGHDIVLTLENGIVVGRVVGGADDGKAAFAISIDSSGHISMVEWLSIQHPVTSNPDDSLTIANGAIVAVVTATDGDGDTSTASTGIGSLISFQDDGPTIDVTKAADAGVLVQTQDHDTIGAATDTASSSANFGGIFGLTSAGGSDGAANTPSLGYTLGVPGAGANGVDSGLDQTGANIYLYTVGGVVVGSTSATSAGVNAANTVFNVSVSGTGIVTLTQFSQIDHPIAGDPTPTGTPFADQLISMADGLITLTATASITDGDGDTATDSETVNIGANLQFADDGPIATNDTDSIVGGNGPATGNVITGVDIVGGDANSTDGNADSIGADTPGTITKIQSVNVGANVDTTYDASHNLVVNGQYGTLTINEDGSYSYLRTSAVGGVSDVFTYTLTDRDGDTSTATLTIGIEDKFPVAGNIDAVVDDDDVIGANGNPGGVGDVAPSNATGNLPGSGGDGSLTWDLLATGAPAGFSYADGPNGSINVFQDGNANPVMNITINTATGAYTITELQPILHPSLDGLAGDNTENNVSFTINYTVTDADGDPASGTLHISVNDDTPTVNVTQGSDAGVNLTTHDALTIGAASDTASSSANFGGVFGLTQSAGADGTNAAATLAYVLGVSAPGVDSGLDQGGANIFLYTIGGKVVGSTSATVGGVTTGNTVFDVSVSGTGVVTLTQYSQIDHPIGSDPTPTGTPFADHIVSMVDSLITLTASATLTDKDGDTVSDSETVNIGANLHFTDDGPTAAIGTTGQHVSIDESAGLQADSNDVAGPLAQFAGVTLKGVDPDMATQFAANANAVVNSTGTLFGADGAGTAVFSLNVSSAGVDSGLNTTDGHDIVLTLENGIVVGRVVGGADDGKAAFAISIDSSGHISMVEWLSIQHPVTSNPDDSLSIANGAVLAVVTATDSDGDTSTASTAIGNLISFQDSGPIMTAASNINIQNGGDVANTGTFAFNLGADGANATNDVISIGASSATVNGVAVTNYVLTAGVENATTASYSFSFDYPNGTGTTAHETGTLVFDKAAGTYTVDLDNPISGFSVLATAGAPASAFVNYNADGTTSQGPSNIATVGLANDFFMQFTGDSGGSHTTVAPDGTFVAQSGVAFNALELFTGSAATVTVSSSAAGVAGNTIQGGEVLDFNLYSTDPHQNVGTPTQSATSMFIELDGVGSSEDMIVVLKLLDTSTGKYSEVALMVQNGDIITSNATLAGTAYAGISLDNNDGLIVIEANDYQNGNTNLVIVGAQIAGSDAGVTGTAENFNGSIGASGGWDGTSQPFSTDVSDQPFKIQNIGFLRTTTTDQTAHLTFDVTVKDGDGDTVTQTIVADVTGSADSSTPIALGAAVTTVAPVVLDLNGDGAQFLATDAGVHYDYGHGSVATAWASPQDGILVNDANHNGTVDNASEFVFGSGSVTDLQALAAYDSNHDGQLSSADANFANFAVWQDANSNGVADAGEVQTLTARGITSISLSTNGVAYSAAGGDVSVAGTGSYTKADGSTGSLADAAFQTESRTATNSVLMGALAAAGLAAESSAAATTTATLAATTALTGVAGLHTQAFSPVALDAVSGDHVNSRALLGGDNGAAHAADQSAASHASDAGQAHSQSVANDDAQSKQGPTELLQGTQAPAHDTGVSASAVAAFFAMPAAAQLAGGNAQHNAVVGQVLADALHGGANGATLDSVLASLPGHSGANAALETLASQSGSAVPNGDSHGFAGFTAAHGMFMMEAMVVHQDAVPQHA